MTSTHALQLATEITQNDPATIEPLIKLLYAFVESRGDPLGEAMMQDVIGSLYLKTDHCDRSLKGFASVAA